jgi:hypothetical protein
MKHIVEGQWQNWIPALWKYHFDGMKDGDKLYSTEAFYVNGVRYVGCRILIGGFVGK